MATNKRMPAKQLKAHIQKQSATNKF
uniref:Uncharacterized protein n=1 Tax=Rhizophora mucronata TaxID=61149 RepID=A0A2P2NMG7_RHIMU